jgi:CRISPR-associated protein Csm1
MDPKVRARDSEILPTDGHGGYTHKHVLWTDAFFQWMEDKGLGFPTGIDLEQVRRMAVYHHTPDRNRSLGWLAAEADRLSSGMDRKARDVESEGRAEQPGGWDAFIRARMLSPFSAVDLGLGEVPQRFHALGKLAPGAALIPESASSAADNQAHYRMLWDSFTGELEALCQLDDTELFCSGLLSLSERYTFAVPSSTVDQPDISLHDHNRTVAAIAAALHSWHETDGSLENERAIRDRGITKYRFVAGDLSGIQHSLFLLANQQVRGVNKILRARSFLLGAIVETAALLVRQALGLPVFNTIQSAGGRFLLLAPDRTDLEERLVTLAAEVGTWLRDRYIGELSLNLVASAPFAGADFMPARLPAVLAGLTRRLEEAKLQPLADEPGGVLPLDYGAGECSACGVRPARHGSETDRHCDACRDELNLGGWLPRAVAFSFRRMPPRSGERAVSLCGGLWLHCHMVGETLPASSSVLSGFRLERGDGTIAAPWPLRFVANYVPTLREGERYEGLEREGEAGEVVRPGDIKSFAMIARDALEDVDGEWRGRPLLAVLKADVDRLGFVFGYGLSDPNPKRDRATLGRYAALSRMLDLFFTGQLPARLRSQSDLASTYTVYAGGDDLLLIGPWRQTIQLADELNREFRAYTGHNPSITISVGIELAKANHPLNRTVRMAEFNLERAKEGGRDRICLLGEAPLTWSELPGLLQDAESLNKWLRSGKVGVGMIYRLLDFAREKQLAEAPDSQPVDMRHADWRARWAYHLARNVRAPRALSDVETGELMGLLNRLLGLDGKLQRTGSPARARVPVSIALYRNRN